ncbi:MAG: PH domain-containing protein [Clostridia bacterium]|nr:PH domain-containing protein [Clostridia bacterium]
MEVKRSTWAEMTWLKVLFFWLIIPIVVAATVAKHYVVRITDRKITVHSGVFNKQNCEYAMAGITQISVFKSFWGGICNYGTVSISLAGNRTVMLEGVCDPYGVKSFIEGQLDKTANATHMLVN